MLPNHAQQRNSRILLELPVVGLGSIADGMM